MTVSKSNFQLGIEGAAVFEFGGKGCIGMPLQFESTLQECFSMGAARLCHFVYGALVHRV